MISMIITGLIIIAASIGAMCWYATADLYPEYNDKAHDVEVGSKK